MYIYFIVYRNLPVLLLLNFSVHITDKSECLVSATTLDKNSNLLECHATKTSSPSSIIRST